MDLHLRGTRTILARLQVLAPGKADTQVQVAALVPKQARLWLLVPTAPKRVELAPCSDRRPAQGEVGEVGSEGGSRVVGGRDWWAMHLGSPLVLRVVSLSVKVV